MSSNTKPHGTQAVFDWRAQMPVHPAAEIFPLMPETELKELAADIEKNGLRMPIVACAYGKYLAVLDGRNRLDAMALTGRLHNNDDDELCFGDKIVGFTGVDINKTDPYAAVVSLNLHRRHLTAEQKRDLIAKLVTAKPDLSDRQLGKMAKASKNTVASVRTDLESRGQLDHVEKRTDTKGRRQPAKRTRAAKVEDTIEAKVERASRRGELHLFDLAVARFTIPEISSAQFPVPASLTPTQATRAVAELQKTHRAIFHIIERVREATKAVAPPAQ